jgi:hypothetical protein
LTAAHDAQLPIGAQFRYNVSCAWPALGWTEPEQATQGPNGFVADGQSRSVGTVRQRGDPPTGAVPGWEMRVDSATIPTPSPPYSAMGLAARHEDVPPGPGTGLQQGTRRLIVGRRRPSQEDDPSRLTRRRADRHFAEEM